MTGETEEVAIEVNNRKGFALKEWKRLFNLCHNSPPPDLEVGTIIMPIGNWLDHAGSALNFFKERFRSQKELPFLVVAGKRGRQEVAKRRRGVLRKPETWGARELIRAFKIFSNLTDEEKTRLVAEPESTNTKEQAENVYQLLEQGKIKQPLVVIVFTYHLPRFVSTLVKTILEKEGEDFKTRVYTVPVSLGREETPRFMGKETKGERKNSEVRKIHSYRIKGDVASEENLKQYIDWLRRFL